VQDERKSGGTLDAHRALWGQEPADKRYSGEPTRLTGRARIERLLRDTLARRIRPIAGILDRDALARALA
jgi:hypothetical protein